MATPVYPDPSAEDIAEVLALCVAVSIDRSANEFDEHILVQDEIDSFSRYLQFYELSEYACIPFLNKDDKRMRLMLELKILQKLPIDQDKCKRIQDFFMRTLHRFVTIKSIDIMDDGGNMHVFIAISNNIVRRSETETVDCRSIGRALGWIFTTTELHCVIRDLRHLRAECNTRRVVVWLSESLENENMGFVQRFTDDGSFYLCSVWPEADQVSGNYLVVHPWCIYQLFHQLKLANKLFDVDYIRELNDFKAYLNRWIHVSGFSEICTVVDSNGVADSFDGKHDRNIENSRAVVTIEDESREEVCHRSSKELRENSKKEDKEECDNYEGADDEDEIGGDLSSHRDSRRRFLDQLGEALEKDNVSSNQRDTNAQSINELRADDEDVMDGNLSSHRDSRRRFLDQLGEALEKDNVSSNQRDTNAQSINELRADDEDVMDGNLSSHRDSRRRFLDQLGEALEKDNVSSNQRDTNAQSINELRADDEDVMDGNLSSHRDSRRRFLDQLGEALEKDNVSSNQRNTNAQSINELRADDEDVMDGNLSSHRDSRRRFLHQPGGDCLKSDCENANGQEILHCDSHINKYRPNINCYSFNCDDGAAAVDASISHNHQHIQSEISLSKVDGQVEVDDKYCINIHSTKNSSNKLVEDICEKQAEVCHSDFQITPESSDVLDKEVDAKRDTGVNEGSDCLHNFDQSDRDSYKEDDYFDGCPYISGGHSEGETAAVTSYAGNVQRKTNYSSQLIEDDTTAVGFSRKPKTSVVDEERLRSGSVGDDELDGLLLTLPGAIFAHKSGDSMEWSIHANCHETPRKDVTTDMLMSALERFLDRATYQKWSPKMCTSKNVKRARCILNALSSIQEVDYYAGTKFFDLYLSLLQGIQRGEETADSGETISAQEIPGVDCKPNAQGRFTLSSQVVALRVPELDVNADNAGVDSTDGSRVANTPPPDDEAIKLFSKLLFTMMKDKNYPVFSFEVQLRKAALEHGISVGLLRSDDGCTLLHEAVIQNRAPFILALFRIGCWNTIRSLTVQSERNVYAGKTAEQIAVSLKLRKIVKEMDTYTTWEKSMNVIHCSARVGNFSDVKKWLEYSSDLHKELDSMQCTSLYWACIGGSLETVQLLLSLEVDPMRINQRKENLLHAACMLGHSHLIEILVKECKQDFTAKDIAKKTPLLRVAENGDQKSLVKFVECEMSKELMGPLLAIAGHYGRLEFIRKVVEEYGIDLQSKDEAGKSALIRATEQGKLDVLRYCFSKPLNFAETDSRKRNVLHVAAEGATKEVMEFILTSLKDNRVDIGPLLSARDKYIGGELCMLIRGKDKGRDSWHYVEVSRSLMDVFMKRTRSGTIDVAKYGTLLLSGWGVDPDEAAAHEIEKRFEVRRNTHAADDADVTPLHIAAFKDKADVAGVLIDNGADVNCRDKFGLTPLHTAAMRGNIQLVSRLVEAGADTDLLDGMMKTAAEVAEDNEHPEVVNYLKGRKFVPVVNRFRTQVLSNVCKQFSEENIRGVQESGRDLRAFLINALRDLTVDINETLIGLGSGPVLEESNPNR